ncbi:MAG: response regulator [Clostridia bacterium]|nr:response regulator [Clostridia bacterium]
MKILIVDDEEYLREDLRDALERVSPGNEYSFAAEYGEAVKLVRSTPFDIAFLDIQMPGKNGLELAQMIKKERPQMNIVMVTAYSKYALDALRLFVSGYLLKPVMDKDLRETLENLRNPIEKSPRVKRLKVKCFGNFEVFSDGKPVVFRRQREKEMLAYLICLKGASAGRSEICATVFDESFTPEKAVLNFKTISSSLRKDLTRLGFENILIHNSNSYAVDTSLLDCDYYNYLTGVVDESDSFRGEFMNQYSWAEEYIYMLENY